MSEASHQEAFFKWLEYSPKIRNVTFAIPNGGKRDPREARRLKLQGVTAGVPDIFVAIASGLYHGLFIEFKYGSNKLTKKQQQRIEYFEYNNYQVVTCYAWYEARDVLKEYLKFRPEFLENTAWKTA